MPGGSPAPKVERHRKRGQSLGQSSVGLRLPRGGRKGKLPRWPFASQSDREKALWRRLWRTPASAAWELLGWHDIVARYARVLAEAELEGFDREESGEIVRIVERRVIANARMEARQLEDRLGLTPMAMARLRWVIVDEEPEEKESAPDVRQRLRAM
jgi:hypothetical protein